MQREAGEVSREGEMLTFSREQRCIEAAVAVASLPPSPLCISLSLPSSRSLPLPFLFSSVQNDGDEKLAADQNNPPRHQCLLSSPHALSTISLSLTRSPSLSLFLFPLFLFLFPLFCVCASLLFQLPPSLTLLTSHLLRAPFFPFSSLLIPSSRFLSHLLSTPLPASLHLNSHV